MAANEEFVNFVIDQLSEFGEVQTRKMFGGTNLFRDGLMFAKIKGSTLRLKVNDSNLKDYEELGMQPYYYGKDNQKKLNFYEVPAEILEDKHLLNEWATKAFAVAVQMKK